MLLLTSFVYKRIAVIAELFVLNSLKSKKWEDFFDTCKSSMLLYKKKTALPLTSNVYKIKVIWYWVYKLN